MIKAKKQKKIDKNAADFIYIFLILSALTLIQ
jgi:hypothetical protein